MYSLFAYSWLQLMGFHGCMSQSQKAVSGFGQKRHPGAEAVSFRLHDAMGLVTILAGGKTGGTTGAPRVTSRGFRSRFFTGKLGFVEVIGDFFHVNHHQTSKSKFKQPRSTDTRRHSYKKTNNYKEETGGILPTGVA